MNRDLSESGGNDRGEARESRKFYQIGIPVLVADQPACAAILPPAPGLGYDLVPSEAPRRPLAALPGARSLPR
jgi:hypothetical protein